MVRLIIFECKKHFFKRAILIAIVLFSLIDVVKIGDVYHNKSYLAQTKSWDSAYWQLHDDFNGKMTADKARELLRIFKPLEQLTADRTATTAQDVPGTYTGNYYSDYLLLNWYFVQPMDYAYNYHEAADGIADIANENMEIYKNSGNAYEYRKNARISEMFAGRTIRDFYYTEMWQQLQQYDFSVLLVLLIVLFGISSVFSIEKETDMELIVQTSRAGGRKTIFAKIIASLLFTSAVSLWFWALDFCAFGLIFGTFEGATLPVFALRDFMTSPLNMSLGEYTILSGLVKTLGMAALCMCLLFIANFFRNALLPFIWGALSAIGLIVYEDAFLNSSHVLAKNLTPFALIENIGLFHTTEFLNVFGIPVSSWEAAIAIGFLWIGLFGVLIFKFSPTNTLAKRGGAA